MPDHGKAIKEIWLQGEGNAYHERVKSDDKVKLTYSVTYHGDRDELWIIVTEEGNETRRINARYVTEIIWQQPTKG